MHFVRPLLAISHIGVFIAAGFGSTAFAQQIFKIVGTDGRVTFADKPSLEANARSTAAPMVQLSPAASASPLPFELQQAASRYPVTFYTAPNCDPCATGRALLASRGVPFSEKTVTSNEDIATLQRLSGANSLPFLTIGGQPLKGYSETEWTQFLDAAGYPKTSQLPAGYQQVPAAPLVAAQQPTRPTAATAPAPRAAGTAPVPAAPADNPNGIRF